MAVDKLVDSTQLDADLTSVANAIRAKSGGSSQLAFPSGFVSEIGNIPTSSSVVEPDPLDVDIIDYDGTLLYTYTAQDFLALTELPANPSHDGLTAQGWNWSLTDAKNFVSKYGSLVIGQMYTTSNGRTRIYIHIPVGFPVLTVPIWYTQSVKNGTKIYWGDGTSDVNSNTANTNASKSHTYASAGDYVIEIEVLDGEITALGRAGANNGVLGDQWFAVTATKIEIGNGVTGFSGNVFKWMRNLKTLSLPKTLINQASYNEDIFYECESLKAVVFPVDYVGRTGSMFGGYMMIRYISVPKNQTGLSISSPQRYLRKLTVASLANETDGKCNIQSASSQCMTHFVVMGTYTKIISDMFRSSSARKLFIPATVTDIAATAFSYNKYCEEIHLYPTTPPSLANTNAFNQTTGTFYVPYSADHSILAAYQSATNWSTFASRMVEEPA